MKISTRIAVGLGLLIGLMAAAAAYQLSVVQKLEGMTREVAGNRLEASRTGIALLQDTENVLEFAAKTLLLGDADYQAEWARSEARLEERLQALEGLPLGDAEGDARQRILESWAAWTEAIAPFRLESDPAGSGAPPAPAADAAGNPAANPAANPIPNAALSAAPRPEQGPAAALQALDVAEPALFELMAATRTLLSENDARVSRDAARAAETAAGARVIASVASGITVLCALLLGWILWASISGPLRRLTRGTQELARGRFEHRIEDRSRSEFGTLARDFNLMAERLDELEELKRDFVSHVSHELKGPLAAVQETILVLLEEIPGPITDRQRYLLELSQGSSDRLSRMISDLLEISRLEADATLYDPAPLLLPAVVRDHLRELEPLATDRSVALSFEEQGPGWMVGDAERLREVVANLTGNALKFSPDGRSIRVSLAPVSQIPEGLPARYRELDAREHGPFLLLEVTDQGPGVAREHREGIFEKFHQISIDGRKQGQGVGLGLAITRRIVEAHGGAVWADEPVASLQPDEGPGATFRVLLPVRPSRWPELGGNLPTGASSHPRKATASQDPSPAPGSRRVHA